MDSEKQLEVAKRILWKKDPEYRNHVRAMESTAKDEEYERQGRLLADAIAPRLEALESAAAAWAPSSGGAPAAEPLGTWGGSDDLSKV